VAGLPAARVVGLAEATSSERAVRAGWESEVGRRATWVACRLGWGSSARVGAVVVATSSAETATCGVFREAFARRARAVFCCVTAGSLLCPWARLVARVAADVGGLRDVAAAGSALRRAT
jgi:hypothetical protein